MTPCATDKGPKHSACPPGRGMLETQSRIISSGPAERSRSPSNKTRPGYFPAATYLRRESRTNREPSGRGLLVLRRRVERAPDRILLHSVRCGRSSLSKVSVLALGMVLSVCSTSKLVGLFSLMMVNVPSTCRAERFHGFGIELRTVGAFDQAAASLMILPVGCFHDDHILRGDCGTRQTGCDSSRPSPARRAYAALSLKVVMRL